MEPCRRSSKFSKRRQSNNLDPTNNNASLDEPLLGEQRNTSSSTTARPRSSDFSSFSSPTATDTTVNNNNDRRINLSSFSDATPQINNCSKNAASLQTNDNTTSSSKWRPFGDYGLRSPREAMKGLVTKLSSSSPSSNSSSNSVVEDVKSKFAAIHPNNSTLNTKSNKEKEKEEGHAPITSIAILENGFLVTACRSDKYIKLWRIVESSSVDVAIPQEDEEKESVNSDSNEKHDDSKANNSNSSNNSIVQEGQPTHKIEYIHKFKGHISGIIDIIKFDKRVRFLSTSVDKSVKLWELDCTTGNVCSGSGISGGSSGGSMSSSGGIEEECWGPNLLANFANLDKRWIKVS